MEHEKRAGEVGSISLDGSLPEGRRIRVFCSYAHEDDRHREQLRRHLSALEREGHIAHWDDRLLVPGDDWSSAIADEVERADLFCFLVSSDMLASEYCYGIEMKRAMERSEAGEARIIPIVVREVDWLDTPLGRYQALPRDGQPVATWENQDTAWASVAMAIRRTVRKIQGRPPDPRAELSFADGIAAEMRATRAERANLLRDGEDVSALDARLLTLRRQLRQGPALSQGDCLGGRYELIRLLGKGGFGRVWLAWDERDERSVAVKVLHAQHSADPSLVERFYRGARKMGELRHPAVVDVLEAQCEDGGHHFYVMEYVEGGDLRSGVSEGRIGLQKGMDIVLAVGEALTHAAERDSEFVHRDVKPANVLLDAADRPRLTDFDLVRAGDTTGGTRTGAMGTYLFAAPETLRDASSVDGQADVYSLGMTGLFVICGDALTDDVLYGQEAFFDRLTYPPELLEVLRRAIARRLENRTASVREFCDDLRDVLARTQPPAERPALEMPERPPSNPPRATSLLGVGNSAWRGGSGRWRRLVFVGVVGVLATAAVLAWSFGWFERLSELPCESLDTDQDGLCMPIAGTEGVPEHCRDHCLGIDFCPLAAEDVDGFRDSDGCPEPDNDLDGICDPWVADHMETASLGACKGTDRCPDIAEDEDGHEDEDGCFDPDNDCDGICDENVSKELLARMHALKQVGGCRADERTCPWDTLDAEGHCGPLEPSLLGICRTWGESEKLLKDVCPSRQESYNLNEDDDGCPDCTPLEVLGFVGISPDDGVGPEGGFSESTRAALDQLAVRLKQPVYRGIHSLALEVHSSDDWGGRAWSGRKEALEKTTIQAIGMVAYLKGRGVEISMKARGYGWLRTPEPPRGKGLEEMGRAGERLEGDLEIDEWRARSRRVVLRVLASDVHGFCDVQ